MERETDTGKVDVFESPEIQIERNKYLLAEWLDSVGVRLPILGVVVLSNPNVIVVEPPVKFGAILHQTIPVFLRNIPREKVYLRVDEMHRLVQKIVASHQAYFPYPMCSRWGINPNDLMLGVRCERCGNFGMEKRKNGWNCLKCGYVDRLAHEKAIKEWFMLVGDSINNRQCRHFLQLNSHHVASRILQTMNLEKVGNSNNTIVYKWKW